MEEHPTGDALVIPLHVPRRQMRRLVIITVLLPLGALLIFATDPTPVNGAYGGFAILALAVIWTIILAGRRSRRRTPSQLVADAEGISSPKFSLRWDRVERMRIGPMPGLAGGHPALWIEPFAAEDIEWLGTGARAVAGASKTPSIRIPEMNVDIPLDDLARQLEARAGRPLLDRS